ncbi:TPA: MobA/MobL family protein [Staphylococcus aureus]|nr:MobA/MobL family protein [Staphylococcus aureus]
MAIYHFQNKIVSRGKNQSATSKSAYNSASKIYDYKEKDYKDYSNKQCDYSEILLPKNAGVEYSDREFLWNKVHDVENRKDSQLAREIIIGLPTELNEENNVKLAKDFAESLADEGMIVDLNIHKISSDNPHAHLLCTLRGIDENNEFEPKRKGNKFIRDWNTEEKNLEWRKRWETIQNKHLKMRGFNVTVSSETYKNQNIDLEPTLKEGWKARKFEDETGIQSEVSKYNEEIKKRNQSKINNLYKDINDLKSNKLNSFSYMNNNDTKLLKNMAKDLKLFITPINMFKEKERLYDLKEKTSLISDDDTRLRKVDDIEDRETKLEKVREIFDKQSELFFNKNYPKEENNFTSDEKTFITRYILNDCDQLPASTELDRIIEDKRQKEAEISLNTILGNRDISLQSIKEESNFFEGKLNNLLEKNNLSFEDIENDNYHSTNDQSKIDYYISKLERIAKAENILDDYYNFQIKDLFSDSDEYSAFNEVSSIEEKQQLIDFKSYHGVDNTLRMLDERKFIPKYNNEDRTFILDKLLTLQEKEFKPNKSQYDEYVIGAVQKTLLNDFDFDCKNNNDIKHLFQETNLTNDNDNKRKIEEFYESNDVVIDKEQYNNYYASSKGYGLINASFDNFIFNFNELFRERLPKYINHQYKGKNHSKKRHEVRNKRGIHL